MSTITLRKWGGAVAVSLPKKVLASLDLQPGSKVEVRIEAGDIVLSPARRRFTLDQLAREQEALELARGGRLSDNAWLGDPAHGRELL
jgi:antitoxin component of MazEF toxin-antitoxin module